MEAAPLNFSDPDGLCRSMTGAGVLYNTYWVRFARGRTTFDLAVENSRALFKAAERAGVGRVVHFSVANASTESGLPYFRGKGQVEDMLKGLGIPYAIIRPTLVFGASVEAGSQSENTVADAAGPETFSFEALLRCWTIGSTTARTAWAAGMSPSFGATIVGRRPRWREQQYFFSWGQFMAEEPVKRTGRKGKAKPSTAYLFEWALSLEQDRG